MKRFTLAVLFAFLILTSAFPGASQRSVYFLDVGQGDCEILISGSHAVLVGTATEEMSSRIVSRFSIVMILEGM
ncbi:MAG: hypothetical protein ABSF77_11550 [Spirochaetia bacterium]|jgi:beta-lactamase superfamily II metal-dependent hydrolase